MGDIRKQFQHRVPSIPEFMPCRKHDVSHGCDQGLAIEPAIS